MRPFKKEQHVSQVLLKFFAMLAGTVILFLIAFVVVRAAWGMYGTFELAIDARDDAEGQLAALKANEARLSSTVDDFNTSEGVAREMRERYGVALPGEGVIDIVRNQASSTPQPASNSNIITNVFRSLFVW